MFNTRNSLSIVIPGGSGQVGQVLAAHLHAKGHTVTVLARSRYAAPWRVLPWDGKTLGQWAEALDGADVVINLAGRSVNCRYTAANQREIKESRVLSTRVIGQAISQAARPPGIWMNASTATIYRHALDRPMDEATGEPGGNEPGAPAAWNFSIDVAKSWEEAFFAASTTHTRKIALRSAMTMSPSPDGIFGALLRLVRMGLGGTAGTGRQFISWIHEADFLRAIEFLMANDPIEGCVNLCSPNPLPNREFMRILRSAWGTQTGLPAAEWMLKAGAFFMRTETELILKSRRVVPGRLLKEGFTFSFPEWPAAAADLVRCWRRLG